MSPFRTRILVIGGGIAGLSAAIELSLAGLDVTVLERSADVGGKARTEIVSGRPIASGPTVFTMRWVFDEMLGRAGFRLSDCVTLQPLACLARHAWRGSSHLDLFTDFEASVQAIEAFAGPREAEGYRAFSAMAAKLFAALDDPFMRSGLESPASMARDSWTTGFASVGPATLSQTLATNLRRYFRDPRLLQLFGRYATYTGSSPYRSPALLMLIAHVEQKGVWSLFGGLPALARALAKVAVELGVQIRCDCPVSRIELTGSTATGALLANGERLPATAIVFCGDADALGTGLLGPDVAQGIPQQSGERSMSALTWTTLARSCFPLRHHTVFFSQTYKAEFSAIFNRRSLPTEPTIYVCAPTRGDADEAPAAGSAEPLFMLVNAPAADDASPLTAQEIAECRTRTLGTLNSFGMDLKSDDPTVTCTPNTFSTRFPGSGGALYGQANHGWTAAFRRPKARTAIGGLYLAGGSVHPGPGVPMAALSGRLASASLLADLASTSRLHPVATHGGTWTPSTTISGTG